MKRYLRLIIKSDREFISALRKKLYTPAAGGPGPGTDPYETVVNFAALPAAGSHNDEIYVVLASQGTKWLPGSLGGTYYAAGLYYSNGSSWIYLGAAPHQATQLEVNAESSTDTFVTPDTLGNWMDQRTISASQIAGGNIDDTEFGYLNGVTAGIQGQINANKVSINGSVGAISFSASNNVTFGFNASTITASASFSQSNPNLTLQAFGNTTNSSTGTWNASVVSLFGMGDISVGFSPTGALSISGSQSNQQITGYAVGNTTQQTSNTFNASNLSFNGQGIVSVGMSNGFVNISGSQSIQTQSLVSINNLTGNISFSNANNVSFGLNGSTFTATATFAQSNQQISAFAVSNTTQSTSGTLNAANLSFHGAGVASVGISNGSVVISVPSGGGAGDGVNILAAGTQTAATTGTVLFQSSHNVTFGMSNSSVITASASFPAQTNQNISQFVIGNTTQSSSTVRNASQLSYSGAGIITVGLSDGALKISATVPAQTVQTQNMVSINGSTGAISFSESNNVTFGFNASTITASASFPAQTNQNISLFALGNTTQSSSGTRNASNFSISGAGIISVGFSDSAFKISATVPAQTVQTQNLVSIHGQTGNHSWSNSNNVSFGLNGSTITATATFAQSVQTQNLVSIHGQTGNHSWSNSNNVSFGLNGSTITATATFAQSNQQISLYALGNTTQSSSGTRNASNFSISGVGIISVGFSDSAFKISATQSVQTLGLYAVSNTTQSTSGTMSATNLSFHGAGIASVGVSNGSVVISVPSGGGAGDGVNIFAAGGSTANTTGTIAFIDTPNVTWGLTNATQMKVTVPALSQLSGTGGISLSTNGSTISVGYSPSGFIVGNTTGESSSSTYNGASLNFSFSNGLSGGWSGSSIVLKGPTVVDRQYHEIIQGEIITNCCSITGASFSKRPIFIPFWIDGNGLSLKSVQFWGSRSSGTSLNMTAGLGMYSMANSTQLTLVSSVTQAYSLTTSAQWSGLRVYQFNGLSDMTLSEGRWIAALYFSGSNNSTAVMDLILQGGQTMPGVNGYVYAGTNSSGATSGTSHWMPFWGVYASTTAAFPASVHRSQISGQGSNNVNADIYMMIKEI